MSGTLAPYWLEQFIDADGNPYSGGFIYTYASGGTTPATTYTTSDLDPLTANSNPITLDSAGRVPVAIYLDALSYKFVLKNSAGVTIKTQDNIGSVGLTSSGVYEIFSFYGDPTSPITATSYPSGATYDKCHAGTAIYSIDSALLAAGTYKISAMFLSASGDLVSCALVNLSDGAPDTPLATATGTSTTGATGISGAITFAAGGAAKSYAIKTKVAANSGEVWAVQLVKTA